MSKNSSISSNSVKHKPAVKFGYVIWFNDKSTFGGYLMPNPIYLWLLREQIDGNIFKRAKTLLFADSEMVSSISSKYEVHTISFVCTSY